MYSKHTYYIPNPGMRKFKTQQIIASHIGIAGTATLSVFPRANPAPSPCPSPLPIAAVLHFVEFLLFWRYQQTELMFTMYSLNHKVYKQYSRPRTSSALCSCSLGLFRCLLYFFHHGIFSSFFFSRQKENNLPINRYWISNSVNIVYTYHYWHFSMSTQSSNNNLKP